MPQPIDQPARPDALSRFEQAVEATKATAERDPARRLPPFLRPNLGDDTQRMHAAIDPAYDRQQDTVPVTAITRLIIPFEDVFLFALKLFVAQVIIGVPFVLLIWLAFLR